MAQAKVRRPEIMAPAGGWPQLRAALDAGADAVYFGSEGFNMRAAAKNFTPKDFASIRRDCDAHGAKAYLTLNTIVYERELPKARRLLAAAARARIDAVICWDFAVAQEARRAGLPVFLSTQASVSNSASLLWLREALGVRRFVLARECSIDDLKKIRAAVNKALGAREGAKVELEVFAHGAMCVSVSGRCFMSESLYGKSGNRGECLQPCRREFRVVEADESFEFTLGSDYVMSPQDLCALPFLERVIEAGADSLKIEGRNRDARYVATVTSAYRRAVDFYCERKGRKGWRAAFEALKAEEAERLRKVFNRGFSDGFFMGKPIGQWTDRPDSQSTERREQVGRVANYFPKVGVAEVRLHSGVIAEGDTLLIEGPRTGLAEFMAQGMLVDDKPSASAAKGQTVTLKTSRAVRRGDKVFVARKRAGA